MPIESSKTLNHAVFFVRELNPPRRVQCLNPPKLCNDRILHNPPAPSPEPHKRILQPGAQQTNPPPSREPGARDNIWVCFREHACELLKIRCTPGIQYAGRLIALFILMNLHL